MRIVRDVMVCSIKSESIVKASRHLCKLFPNAKYHVIAVIRRFTSRHLYTSLYTSMMNQLASESIEIVIDELRRHGCKNIVKSVLTGDPTKELLGYAEREGVDLIMLTSSSTSVPPPELVGSTASKIIRYSKTPVIVYTPFSIETVGGRDRIKVITLALQTLSYIGKAISLAIELAKRHDAEVEVLTMRKPPHNYLEKLRRYFLNSNIVFEINALESNSMSKFIDMVISEYVHSDVLIIRRFETLLTKFFKLIGRFSLSKYERVLLGTSPIPTIIT